MWPGRLCCFVEINWLGFERGHTELQSLCYSTVDSHILMRNQLQVKIDTKSIYFNLCKVVNLCRCHPPPPAPPGRLGRPSWVVWGQSHAGKLDWRVHRLLLRFQTQGESPLLSSLCSLFTHSLFLLSFNLSLFLQSVSLLLSLPSLCFSSLSPQALIAYFVLDACVHLYISIKNHVPKHKSLHFVAHIQRVHPTASGNLPKQMMSQISFYWVFLRAVFTVLHTSVVSNWAVAKSPLRALRTPSLSCSPWKRIRKIVTQVGPLI